MPIANPDEGTVYRMDELPPKESLPTRYDLPSEYPENPGVPDEFHIFQPRLLSETFKPTAWDPGQVFCATDLNLNYQPEHPLYYKRPDWLAVLGKPLASRQGDLRLSHAVWLPEAGIGLGVWEGTCAGCTGRWLRWLDDHGRWIPTPSEDEQARGVPERARAEQEWARAERLAECLRVLGLDSGTDA